MGAVGTLIVAVCAATLPGIATAASIEADSIAAARDGVVNLSPGDELVIADGVYTDFRLLLEATGSEDAPIVLRPQTPGGVILTGKSRLDMKGQWLAVDGFVFDQSWGGTCVSFQSASHCRLTNCAFIECGSPRSTFTHIVTIWGRSQHNSVDHCYMQASLSMGIGVRIRTDDWDNTHNRFAYNYFKDIERRWNNGQEAIQIGQGGLSDRTSQFATAEFNLFDNASGDAEIISNKSAYNTYRYNTFTRCNAMLVLRGGPHATVIGNYFLGNSGGIRVHDGYHTIVGNYIQDCSSHGIYMPTCAGEEEHTLYGPVTNCVVAHNTIINCGRVGLYLNQPNTHPAARWTAPLVNNEVIGNLIVSDCGTLVQDDGSLTTTWRGNIAWPTGEATAGLEREGITAADPGLVLTDGIWRLPAENSPAIEPPSPNYRDVNIPIPWLETDMDGQPRDRYPDVGADEVSDAPVTRGPLSPADVGPVWMAGDPANVRRIPNPQTVPSVEEAKAGLHRVGAPLDVPATVELTVGADGQGILEAEALELASGAIIVDVADASGGKAVLLATTNSQGQATVALAKGVWNVSMFLKADDSEHDAARMSVGSVSVRTYPSKPGRTSTGVQSVRADVDADGVYQLTLIAGESGVIVDRIEFRRQ
jgi:poly(beta-D-mannuronate) lyase